MPQISIVLGVMGWYGWGHLFCRFCDERGRVFFGWVRKLSIVNESRGVCGRDCHRSSEGGVYSGKKPIATSWGAVASQEERREGCSQNWNPGTSRVNYEGERGPFERQRRVRSCLGIHGKARSGYWRGTEVTCPMMGAEVVDEACKIGP